MTKQELRKEVETYKEFFLEAYTAIEEGGSWNGKVYNRKGGTRNLDLFVYVDGKHYSLGRHFKEHAQEAKQVFQFIVEEGLEEPTTTLQDETPKTEAQTTPLLIVKTASGATGEVFPYERKERPYTSNMFIVKFGGKVAYASTDEIHLLSGNVNKKSYITLKGEAIKELFGLELWKAKLEVVSFGDGTAIPKNGRTAQLNTLYYTHKHNLSKEHIIRAMEHEERKPVPKAGKDAKWIDGMWIYPSGNYTEDVLSGYYEE